jgi:superfamily II DNA helicase RecQ
LYTDSLKVAQAREKDLEAEVLNEETKLTSEVWKRLSMQLLYLSPEMALGNRMGRLWKNRKFCSHLTCISIDEAHCVHNWGVDDF